MAEGKRRFFAEPGTVISFVAGPDARVCEYKFDDSGALEFDADDQEPVAALEDFAQSDAHPVSEKAPERKAPAVHDFASRGDKK